MYDDEIDITVHKFMLATEDASQPLSPNVLSEATRFVISTTHKTRWRTPPCVDPANFGTPAPIFSHCSSNKVCATCLSFVLSAIRGPCFRYNRSPDDSTLKKPSRSMQPQNTLKDWDEDIALLDHELWSLKDLEEFDHGYLHHLLDTRHVVSPLVTPAPDTAIAQPRLQENTKKRSTPDTFGLQLVPKRLKLYTTSLRSILSAVSPRMFNTSAS